MRSSVNSQRSASQSGRRDKRCWTSRLGATQLPAVCFAVAGSRRWECEDRSARVGHNGHLFLVQGTNRLSALYDDSSDYGIAGGARGRARQWLRVFLERDAECRGRGLRLRPDHHPREAERATGLCAHSHRRSESAVQVPGGESRGRDFYVSGLDPFRHGRKNKTLSSPSTPISRSSACQADVPSARGGRGPGSPDLRGRHRARRTYGSSRRPHRAISRPPLYAPDRAWLRANGPHVCGSHEDRERTVHEPRGGFSLRIRESGRTSPKASWSSGIPSSRTGTCLTTSPGGPNTSSRG